MVLASFQLENKFEKTRFFQETSLLVDTNVKMILGMLFLTLNNVDIQFAQTKITWRSYTAIKALSTIKQVKLIDKKKFAKVALNEIIKAFMIYMTSLSLSLILIYSAKKV